MNKSYEPLRGPRGDKSRVTTIAIVITLDTTSFPGLSCEDEGRDEKALVGAGHVTTRKIAVFDSYSSRSGEIFFNEIYKSSKQINSRQKTSQSILFMCSEVWHESAEISEDPVDVF
jgi:hypothetical protein